MVIALTIEYTELFAILTKKCLSLNDKECPYWRKSSNFAASLNYNG